MFVFCYYVTFYYSTNSLQWTNIGNTAEDPFRSAVGFVIFFSLPFQFTPYMAFSFSLPLYVCVPFYAWLILSLLIDEQCCLCQFTTSLSPFISCLAFIFFNLDTDALKSFEQHDFLCHFLLFLFHFFYFPLALFLYFSSLLGFCLLSCVLLEIFLSILASILYSQKCGRSRFVAHKQCKIVLCVFASIFSGVWWLMKKKNCYRCCLCEDKAIVTRNANGC